MAAGLALIASAATTPAVTAQQPPPRTPTARLVPASPVAFPSDADSNSPAVWERVDGRLELFVLTSVAGLATRHTGAHMLRLVPDGPVSFTNYPGHGVWFEAVIPDVDGTWYGYYHNEWPAEDCPDDPRTIPRIGAAKSTDFGGTWQDLGVILEAPPASYDCASTNMYFVGGVGDFSAVLDADAQYLYVLFSQYSRRDTLQGVAIARMPWADRDLPSGKLAVWLRDDTWAPPRMADDEDTERVVHWPGTPIFPAVDGWHEGESVDAFWGPSVHYNTFLKQYVMLLNRAKDVHWAQEGIYISFTPTLADPASWSAPQRLMIGGRWYPQVVGNEIGTGTDRAAGERARFFAGGRSDHLIQFSR